MYCRCARTRNTRRQGPVRGCSDAKDGLPGAACSAKCNHAFGKPNHQVTKLEGLSNSWCRRSCGSILSLRWPSGQQHTTHTSQHTACCCSVEARQQSALLLPLKTQRPPPSSHRQRPHAAARCLAPAHDNSRHTQDTSECRRSKPFQSPRTLVARTTSVHTPPVSDHNP
jgi:hypothetical protein